ncbi:MAG: DHH family phosphoesterase [Candidatus Thermoplasmatota archaeon]|nr:DHH family phosphoesterase [Candidatus Thermoplasmatota archaeon]
MSLELPEDFSRKLEEAVDVLSSATRVKVVSHYDGDGLCAAGILAKALHREGLSFQVRTTRSLDEAFIETLEGDEDVILMADMGSNSLPALEKLSAEVIVLDHHEPRGDSEKIVHINSHLHGIDGTKGACAATLSFTLATVMDEANWDLAGIALAGAVADRQHPGGLEGLNRSIVKEASEKAGMRIDRTHTFLGDTLAEALSLSINPYVLGISGNVGGAGSFLTDLGISPDMRVEELEGESKTKLISAVSLKLLEQGVTAEDVKEVIEEGYWDVSRGTYANWTAAYVNACGRLGKDGIGVAICLGDLSALEEGKRLRKEFLDQVLVGLKKVEDEGAFEKNHTQFFYVENPSFAGTIGGVAMRYMLNPDLATVALSVLTEKTRISGRATKDLVGKGVNLAEAFKESAEVLGGAGGGHSIAAGASIPKGKEEKFLEHVDNTIEVQLED